jgi:hypothetical protein
MTRLPKFGASRLVHPDRDGSRNARLRSIQPTLSTEQAYRNPVHNNDFLGARSRTYRHLFRSACGAHQQRCPVFQPLLLSFITVGPSADTHLVTLGIREGP